MENTKAIWRDRLARLAKTNLTIEEFATREGVKPSSLKWWRWRFGTEEKKSRAYAPLARAAGISGPTFIEVGSPPASRSSSASPSTWYEVLLTNGRVVRVPSAFDDASLARILLVAERSP